VVTASCRRLIVYPPPIFEYRFARTGTDASSDGSQRWGDATSLARRQIDPGQLRYLERWIAVVGYVLALVLLLGSYYITWSFAVLPL
jgi:hypothetical protein